MNKKDLVENIKYIVLGIITAYMLNFVLGIVLSTNLPVVAVISNSMAHDVDECGIVCEKKLPDYQESFENWWDACGEVYTSKDISREEFLSYPLKGGFNKGDVLIVKGVSVEELRVGDVIIYGIRNQNTPIVHRIIEISDEKISTKGDHNGGIDPWKPTRIHGKAIFGIPYLGWPKLIFNCLLHPQDPTCRSRC